MTRRTAKKATASSARAKKNPQRDSDSGSEWSDDEARRPSRAARAGAAGKKAGTRSGASQASATQRTRRGRSQLVEAEQAEAGVPQAAPSAADATEPAPGDKKPDDPFAFDGGDDNEKDKVQWTPEPPKTGKRVKLWKTQQKKQPTRPVSPTRVFRRPGVVQKKEDDVKESPMAINALLNPIEGPPTDEPPAGPPLLELPDVPFASKRERKKTLPLPQPPEPNPHYDEPAPRRREAAPTTRPDRARRHTKVISYEESQDSQTLLPPPKKTGQRGRKKSSAGDGIRSEEPAEKQSPAETKAGNKRKLPKEESDSLPTKRTKSGEEIVSERDVPLTLTSVFDQFVPKLSPYMNDSKRTNIATLLKLGELLREMERACSSSEEVIRYVAGFTSQDESMLRLALKVARVDPYLRAEGPPKNQALYEFFYERVPKEQWSSFWAYHAGSGLSNVSMTGLDSSWSRYQQGNKSASPKNDRSRAPHGRGAKGRSSTKIVEPKKPRGSLSVKDSPTLVAPVRSSRRSAVAKKEPDDDSSSLSSLSSSSSGEEELVLLNDTPPEVVPLPVPATWKSSKSSSPRPGAHSPSMGTRSQAVSSDKDALKIVVDGVERAQLVDNDTSGSDDDKEGPATRTSARRAAITRSQVAAPAPSRPKRPSSVPSRDSFQAASQRPKGKGAATKAATKLEEDRLVADEGSKEEDEPPRGTRTRASSRLQSQSQSQSQRQGSGRRGRASKRPSRDAGKGAKEAEATVDDSGEDSRATSPAAEHRQATPKLGTPKPPRTSDGDELAEREFRLPAYEASQESPSFPPDDAAQARRVSLPRDDSQIFQRGNTPQMSDSQAIRALDALDMELENVMSSSAGVESSGVAIADSQDSTESQWKSQRPTDTPLMDKSGVHPMDIDYYADPHSDKGPSSADPVQASDELFTPAMQVVSATQYENMLTVARQGGPRQARVPWTESQRRIEPRSSLKSDSPRRTRRSSNFGNAASTIPLRTARFAEAEKQGYRMGSRHDPKPISLHKDMEDAHVVKKEMRHISTGCLYRLVIVADGHGGPDCARFAVEKLPIRIEAKMNDLDEEELTQENIAKAFLTAITEVDKEYLDILRGRFESWKANGADERRRPSDDGSTLIVNAIFPDFNDPESGDEWLLNVNIGDSRTCVLETAHRARFRFDPVYYSDDQHPGHPAKAHHIVQKTGGSAIIKLSEPASMNLKVPRGLHDLVGSLQDGPRNRHIESLRAGRVLRTEEFLGPESEAVLLGLNIGQHINCGDALGDLLFKLNPPVFQCSPDPGWVRLRADRRYLIVAATDGIWDALKVPTKQPKKQAENLASVIQKQYQEEVNRQLFHSEQPGPSLAPNALQNLLDRVAQQLVDIEKNHLKIFTDHTVYDDATAVLVEIEEAEGFGADYVL